MKLDAVMTAMESIAPLGLAEGWDKVGLQIGDRSQRVGKALLCIDLTEAVVAEAAGRKANLIVAYHPPIFTPLARLTTDDWKGRALLECARRRIAVYSPHTALDAAEGGVTDWLCAAAFKDAGTWEPIVVHSPAGEAYKVVVFVPESAQTAVREAMSAAGAGQIGHYVECSFSSSGTGGFRPLEGASPAIGKVGRREEVAEQRLEMVVSASRLAAVMRALVAAHPYEEPAIDVYRLIPQPASTDRAVGAGRLVTLNKALTAKHVVAMAGKACGKSLRVGASDIGAIRSIAVCPGAGGSLFEGVEADAYLTGEMRHHQVLDLVQRGKLVILAGHTHTERPYLPVYRNLLRQRTGEKVDWAVSKADVCPWQAV